MTIRPLRTTLAVVTSVTLVTVAVVVAVARGQAPAHKPDLVVIDAGHPGPAIAPGMFGIFFEDINFAADGGLYPELVKNRSFEFTEPLSGWRKVTQPFGALGEMAIRSEGGLNPSNPHYLRLRGFTKDGGFAIANAGFRGMGVHAGAEYVLSAFVRVTAGSVRGLAAKITGANGQAIGSATLSGFTGQWARYEATITPSATEAKAELFITPEGEGEVDLDMVSLFPKATFKNRPNGLRKDLVQLLADMKPGFIRFPGGCIVEGRRLELRYDWKKTVGDVTERKALINRWNDEFGHRLTPDYFQSFGLGFYEYFQLAEDIGASPLPVLGCGMACQFNSGELVPLDALDPYIQDALDLIEFANGPVSSRWGGLRAKMGHPEPFNLRLIGVGNEQWGPRYIERYERFAAAIKRAHPDVTIVSGAGPSDSGPEFDFAWANLRRLKADIIDEHYYMEPGWFLKNVHRYDKYDRSGPKVFAGEYAAQTSGTTKPDNRNNWKGAIAEAAFITGLERNADVVRMASYAPLFAHVDAWQWTPNLIWFDNLRSFGTPNYYVQKLYATNQGTEILPITVNGSAENAQGGLFTSAAVDRTRSEAILKLVNPSASARPVKVRLDGIQGTVVSGRLIVLASADLSVENSLDQPTKFVPVERAVTPVAGTFEVTLAPQSLTVLRAKIAM